MANRRGGCLALQGRTRRRRVRPDRRRHSRPRRGNCNRRRDPRSASGDLRDGGPLHRGRRRIDGRHVERRPLGRGARVPPRSQSRARQGAADRLPAGERSRGRGDRDPRRGRPVRPLGDGSSCRPRSVRGRRLRERLSPARLQPHGRPCPKGRPRLLRSPGVVSERDAHNRPGERLSRVPTRSCRTGAASPGPVPDSRAVNGCDSTRLSGSRGARYGPREELRRDEERSELAIRPSLRPGGFKDVVDV